MRTFVWAAFAVVQGSRQLEGTNPTVPRLPWQTQAQSHQRDLQLPQLPTMELMWIACPGCHAACTQVRFLGAAVRKRCGARVSSEMSALHRSAKPGHLRHGLYAHKGRRVLKQLCIHCSKSGKRSHHKSACHRYSCFGFTEACQSSEHNRVCKSTMVLLP